MTGDLAFLQNVRDIPPRPVGLPNGKNAFAFKSGSARIGANLVLRNVLFIPQLKCHLLVVS